jgi:YHS domain-containing protein
MFTLRSTFIALFMVVIGFSGAAQAANSQVFTDKQNLAIKGYDVVNYFTAGAPAKGDASFKSSHNGATYHFVSAANKAKFDANPAKYLPAYGGFCAYGAAQGYKVSINPEAWKIVNGKLYLNYSKGVQRKWDGDIAGYIKQADANWPNIKNDKAK